MNGILYFASEIKSILAVAPELAETNYQGLMQYMYFGYIPDPQTAFQRIHKLPPGHLLEFEKGESRFASIGIFPNTARTNRKAKRNAWKSWKATSPRQCVSASLQMCLLAPC